MGIKEIIYAALFHDIGKIAQRADDRALRTGDKTTLAPFNRVGGYHSHTHVLYTDGFLTNFEDKFYNKDVDARLVTALAAKHHKPDTSFEWIISIADWISSGMDRTLKSESEEKINRTYKTQPLKFVFDKINFYDKVERKNYYSLNELNPNRIFPDEDKISVNDYEKIWNNLKTDLETIKELNYEESIPILKTIFEHYLWTIPSSTIHEPDISLYDHSVTTTAFASVLYRYHEFNNSLNDIEKIKDRDDKKFLFISGDLSGIQKYLFDLKTTKYNAKILRARSFELQMISESISNKIIKDFELPLFCKIMNAGGRFIILLPNIKDVKSKILSLREEFDLFFKEKYFGELTLNISDGVEASFNDLMQENSTELFSNISYDIAIAKQKKLQSVLLDKNNFILSKEYNRIESSQDICLICEKRVIIKENATDELCSVCKSLINFGGEIPKANYLEFSEKRSWNSLELFNNYYVKPLDSILDSDDNVYIINEYETDTPIIHIPYFIPSKNNQVLTFEELAQKSEGNKKIAMFKADLDNLGGIFSIGLRKNLSISRYATMSRMLDYFFSEYVNYKIKQFYPTIYTVFSGGDDLCVIGPWDDIIKFSIDINNDFRSFAGENSSLTLSGGISLANPKVPVKILAHNAEENLESSKAQKKKNSITIFDTTVSWFEFKDLIDLGEKFDEYLKDEKLSTSQIYRLLDYSSRERKIKYENKFSPYNALWRSHLKYDVARNIKVKDIKDKEFKDWFLISVVKNIDKIKIAVSYSLYKNRKN